MSSDILPWGKILSKVSVNKKRVNFYTGTAVVVMNNFVSFAEIWGKINISCKTTYHME
jgi:hypothetical protein